MIDHPQAIMLYAAGFGTRMGALTAARPKPLLKVGGKPLIDHAFDLIDAAKIGRTVVNLHYFPDQIRAHLSDRDALFSDENPDILETGGGLRQALPLLGPGPVFTLNSDAVWTGENPLDTLRNAWDPARMDALLLLVPKEAARGHNGNGDFVMAEDGRIAWGSGAVYSGAQIIRTDLLPAIKERCFPIYPLWNEMIAQGRAYGVLHHGGWCDVGRPEGIALAETMLAAQV